jgi:site-specific recombinase
VVAGCHGVRLFTDVGLPAQLGFMSEATDRLLRQVLPEPPVEEDLARLLYRLLPTHRAGAWLEALLPDLQARLGAALFTPGALLPLGASMREATLLLAARVSAHGVADDVRRRDPSPLPASPFLRLPRAVEALLGVGPLLDPEKLPEVSCREEVAHARRAVREVREHLNQTGVSIDLVYRLDLIVKQLDRLYVLIGLLGASTQHEGAGARLLQTLVRGCIRDRSLGELFKASSRLLARRVIERAGHGGGHYITRSKRELRDMRRSAGGGGALTALTALFKFLLVWSHLPDFFEGLFVGLNYGGGFVAMQLLGFTLATKQPSMTAATLAGALQETASQESPDLGPLVELIARTARSQLAALIGNLGLAIPASILIDLVAQLYVHRHVLDDHYAEKMVASLHPLQSLSVPFAILTGVFLWLASVIGGTFENWVVLRQLPGGIAAHRGLRNLIGMDKAERLSAWFLRNASGFAGNLGFGLLLGFAPIVGRIFGLPVDVRHVTFSTATLTYSAMAQGAHALLHPDFLWAMVGVGVIGLLNFTVSFSLALTVALRAREVGALAQLGLLRALFRRFVQGPLDFFRAPVGEPDSHELA